MDTKKITVLFLIALTLGAVVYVNTKRSSATKNVLSPKESAVAGQKTTQYPFEEMTIPFLRSREYKSQLIEPQKTSANNSYTTYLTSYDSDGYKVNGLLTVPKGNPPPQGWPAIVFVHGYIPPKTYKTQEKYTSYVDYLSKNGFVVFKIDLRGHGQSQGEPVGGYYSSDYIIDTLNAHAALKNFDQVDPNDISLWGHSMAGNVTFRSFIASKEIKKIVIWAGAGYTYEDLATYRISDNSYQPPSSSSNASIKRRQLFETHGTFDPKSDFWKQVVPTNYLSGKTGAIELHHAIDDNVVRIDYSRNLMKVLDGSEIKHQLYEYKTGGHNISGTSFNTAMQRTVDFLKESR
jgi:uncharacterized protein